MKPSFQGFVQYIRESKKFDTEQLEAIHNFLYTPKDKVLHINDLIATGLFTREQVINLFVDISQNKIAEITFQCPECAYIESFDSTNFSCDNCGQVSENTYWENLFIKITGMLSFDDKTKLSDQKYIERDANRLADFWYSNKRLPYLIIDLVSSQATQQGFGSVKYSQYLEAFRKFIKYEVLSQINNYLVLGEIGDAVKIAFFTSDDLFQFLNILAKKLPNEKAFKEFGLPQNVEYFPKYSAIATLFDLPKNPITLEEINPRDLIVTTLNGAIDINSEDLTELFRIDSKLSIKNELYAQYELGAIILEPLLIELGYSEAVTEEITTYKGDMVSGKGRYGVILFGEKEINFVENPTDAIS